MTDAPPDFDPTLSQTLTLAELLCARLCHDLAGPIGAAAAGAELLEEAEDLSPADREALDLLSASAQTAMIRVKFLRAAFGPAAPITWRALRDLAQGFLGAPGNGLKAGENGSFELQWETQSSNSPCPPDLARLLLNLILLGRDSLPLGGTLTLAGETAFTLRAQGNRAALPAAAQLALAEGKTLDGRGAQALLLRGLTMLIKFRLETCQIGGGINFFISKPE